MAEMDAYGKARLERALLRARVTIVIEQSARIWAPLALAAGALAVAGLWGLFDLVPRLLRSAATFSVLGLGLAVGVFGARQVRWPSRGAARLRLEQDSGLLHTPLSVLEERQPATGDSALWTLHRQRTVEAARTARVSAPRAGLASSDPIALRYVLVVAAGLALWARGPDHANGALEAFRPVRETWAAGRDMAVALTTTARANLISGDHAPAASHPTLDAPSPR